MKTKEKPEKKLADILFPTEEQAQAAESILDIPPEQRRLHTDTYDFTVSTLVDYLKRERVRIPEYQRRYVWKENQASRLIESLIIQCPIPIIYLNQEKDETLTVIDGNQRLTSLRRFLNNEFSLTGLTAYPELDGLHFFELDNRFQRHIENRTLRCLVILKDTHPQVKFDVFERLNTGSVKLTSQELRHGIYYGDMILIGEMLAKNQEFCDLVVYRDNRRMKLEELVLRFLALRFNRGKYRKPMVDFINTFCENHRKISDSDKKMYNNEFIETVRIAKDLYGDYAFKIIDKKRKVISRFNAALYDAEMLTASEFLKRGIKLPSQGKVLDAIENLLQNNDVFRKSIVQSTSDEAQVKSRADILLKSILSL